LIGLVGKLIPGSFIINIKLKCTVVGFLFRTVFRIHHFYYTKSPIKLSISELIQYVSVSAKVDKELIKHYANEMKLDIDSNMNKSFFKLSGGMKQKLLIAISLAKKSDIIIYDEPTANLDPKARDDFYRLLKQNEDDKVLLFVTHRLEEVEQIVNRQVYMDMGKIISDEII